MNKVLEFMPFIVLLLAIMVMVIVILCDRQVRINYAIVKWRTGIELTAWESNQVIKYQAYLEAKYQVQREKEKNK